MQWAYNTAWVWEILEIKSGNPGTSTGLRFSQTVAEKQQSSLNNFILKKSMFYNNNVLRNITSCCVVFQMDDSLIFTIVIYNMNFFHFPNMLL